MSRAEQLSIEEEHTRIAVAAVQSLQKGVDGASLLKFAERHIITDGRPPTTGSGKLYFKKDMRKGFDAIVFCVSFKFVLTKKWLP